jgi:CxxC motif-containing protein
MTRKLTCIECPKGCSLTVDIEDCKVKSVQGHQCPKGLKYAAAEVGNPVRILTSAVLTRGLEIKMLPVRTDKPIPKSKLMEGMLQIKSLRVEKPVRAGEVLVNDFLGTGANLVATREAIRSPEI